MCKMFVCDFYNLYIPKGYHYENKNEGILIEPLEIAEEFEKNRKKSTSEYSINLWKTAKCQIKLTNENEAKKIANWLQFLYSFAQSRTVCFLDWSIYEDGKKISTTYESKFFDRRENHYSDLIYGTKTKGSLFTRDINLFFDTSIGTLRTCNKQDEIIRTIHAYTISDAEPYIELNFLVAWIAIEHLANSYYNVYKSANSLFNKNEKRDLKQKIENFIDTLDNNKEDRYKILKRNIQKNYLYEFGSLQKVIHYLKSLDLGFEEESSLILLEDLYEIRIDLVHNFSSTKLSKNPQYLMKLQKILEQIIFRLLGVNRELQNRFILHQYDEPKLIDCN